MKPLIRQNIDSLVFVPPEHIHKYDVVLYRRNGQAIMHRVTGVRGDTCLIRGDNSNYTEEVPTGDIFGVMQGFYRGSAMWPRPRWAIGCFPGAGCCSIRCFRWPSGRAAGCCACAPNNPWMYAIRFSEWFTYIFCRKGDVHCED